MELPNILQDTLNSLSNLPGVGEKSALRYVLSIAKWDDANIEELSRSIEVLRHLKKCEICGVYSDSSICLTCSDEKRKHSGIICIVESIVDYLAIERSGEFAGVYHVLGGVLNPLQGIGPRELNVDKLVHRIKNNNIEEVILALNPSVEGDATCSYIKNQLGENISVNRIGFGIPIGGSLEYLDNLTIGKALENKKRL